MFAKYMKYRTDNKIDTISKVSRIKDKFSFSQAFNFVIQEQIITREKAENLQLYHPKGYMGVDKIGRPVYIERSGQMNPNKLWEHIDEPTLVRNFMFYYEEVIKLHFFACSLRAKKQVYHTFSILDMTGFSVSMFNKRV